MARVGTTLALMSLVGLGAATAGFAQAQAPAGTSEQAASQGKAEGAGKRKPAQKVAKKSDAKAKADAKAAGGDSAKRDPAAAQKSLDTAQKSLDGGKTDAAVAQATSLIDTGGLDARSMARALAIRGHAYKKQGKPAQAIADLQSALYLKNGLNDAERASAQAARADAYREAGLGEAPSTGGQKATAKTASVPAATPSAPIATAAVPPKSEPATTGSAAGGGSGGIGGFFSNIFGGSQGKSQPAPETTASAPVKAPAEPAVSSWSETIKPASGGKAMPKAGTAVAAAPAAAVAKTDAVPAAAKGKYRLQLAALRSRDEAKSMADRVKSEFGSQIGQRSYQVEEAAFGNMGTFYRVNIGPFADASESKSLCTALRGKGIDCLVHGD